MGRVRDTWRHTLDLHFGACHPRNSADYDSPATPFTSLLLPSGELCMGYSLFSVWQRQPALGSLPYPFEFPSAANPNQRPSIGLAKTEALDSRSSHRSTSPRLMATPALVASPHHDFLFGNPFSGLKSIDERT
jgi:hypothetical protein